MAEDVATAEPPAATRRLRHDWARRLINELLALLIALIPGGALRLAIGRSVLNAVP